MFRHEASRSQLLVYDLSVHWRTDVLFMVTDSLCKRLPAFMRRATPMEALQLQPLQMIVACQLTYFKYRHSLCQYHLDIPSGMS